MNEITVRYDGILVDREIPGERFLWSIHEPFRALWETESTKGEVYIPKHFVTNFASVPRPLWAIVPPWDGHIRKAAVCHDLLYGSQEFSRAFADDFLFYAMVPLGAPLWKRRVVWAGVRVGGWCAYANGVANQTKNIETFNFLTTTAPLGSITIYDDTLGYLDYVPPGMMPDAATVAWKLRNA